MSTKNKWILIGKERFYYEEVELFRGLKRMNLVVAKENLQIFYSIIEMTNIRYGIFFGTLLGAIREKNFIAHDDDTDIYILEEEYEKFLNLLTLFQEQGLKLVRLESDMLSLMRNNEYIDVYFFKLKYKFGIRKVRVFGNNYEYAAEYLEKPIRQMFLGMNISMPNNPEKLLKKIFGNNWKTPIINSSSQPNTIYSKFSKFSQILKNLPFYASMEKFMKGLLKRVGL